MEPNGHGFQEEKASYSIISFPSQYIPKQYRNLVLSKWLRSLKYGNEYFKLIDPDPYYKVYQVYIDALLARSSGIIRLAVLSEDHDVVLGFSLIEVCTLHYVHVNHEFRNKGIGTSLVPGEIDIITHVTKPGLSIWNKKLPNAKFNPFY